MKKLLISITVILFSISQNLLSIDLDFGLVAHYPFNSNANDVSGNGNNGIIHGNVTPTSDNRGCQNSAYYFPGASNGSDWIEVPDAAILNLGSDFSVSYWIKAEIYDFWVINKGNDLQCGTWGIHFPHQFEIGGQYCNISYITTPNWNNLNQWQHFTFTKSSITNKLYAYINGVKVIESNFNTSSYSNNTFPLAFGRHIASLPVNPAWAYPFKGTLDNIRIYNITLSDSAIQQLYILESTYSGSSITASPTSVNFGDRTCLSDTTITITLSNPSSTAINVSQTFFSMGSNSKLNLTNGGAFTIAGNDSIELSINIKPTATGIINDTLIIAYTGICDTLLKIPITGIRDTIDFILSVSDTLYFGRTCPNIQLDTLLQVQNKSSRATLLLRNNLTSPFSITGTDPFASAFALNETKSLHLRFISPDTGVFYQNLIITDTCGKSRTIVLKADIHVPVVDAGVNQVICLRDSVVISSIATGGISPYTYSWSPSAGLSNPNSANTKASPDATRMYYVTVTDKIGCSSTDSIKITVNPLPQPTITGASSVCENQTYVYFTSAPIETFNKWTLSGATSVDSTRKDTLIIVWSKSGTGRIKLVQSILTTGCFDSLIVDVTINPIPKPDIIGKITGCANSIEEYYTTQTGTINSWSVKGGNIIGDPNRDSIDVMWTSIGKTQIKLVQSYPTGCKDSIEKEITINPTPIVKLDDNAFICIDSIYTLTPIISSGTEPWAEIKWTPTDGLSNPKILNPTVSQTISGTYKYTLTVTDANGCIGTDSINVIIHPQANIILSKSIIDFGTLDPCVTSKDDSLEISNAGTENIIIVKYTDNAGFSIVSPPTPYILKPGEKKTIVISYSANSVGQVSGDITISGSPCGWIKNIQCRANKSEMFVKSDPTLINFGQSLSCLPISKDTIFVVTNTGSSNVSIYFGNIILGAPFTVLSPKTTRILAPKDTIQVRVNYAPTVSGDYSEDLRIPFEVGSCKDSLKISLMGKHTDPVMSSTLRNIVFPDILGCEPSRDTTITLQNTGTINVVIVGVEPSSIFSTTGKSTTIPAGEQIELTIKFSPNNIGSYSGILIIRYDPCGMTDTVIVSGNKQGVLFAVTDSIDFGEIVFCNEKTKSKTILFTIDNKSSIGIDGVVKSLLQISDPFNTTLNSGDPLLNGQITTKNISVIIDSNMPDGEITGTLDFVLSPCDSIKIVKLRVKKSSVKLTNTSSIDFGAIDVGSFKEDTIRIKNAGTTDAIVDPIGAITASFELIKTVPQLPATLKPNEELIVIIRYTPKDSTNDVINIAISSSSPCIITMNTTLKGRGNPFRGIAKVVIYIDSISSAAGQLVYLPLKLRSSENFMQSGESKQFTAKIRFNSTLLIPDFATDMSDIINNERIISISGSLSNPIGVMKEMSFRSGLGNANCTDMIIDTVIWVNSIV